MMIICETDFVYLNTLQYNVNVSQNRTSSVYC